MQDTARHSNNVWEDCLRIIENNILPVQYETWFKPIRFVSLAGDVLTLEVPTEYYRSFIEENFIDLLSRTLKRVIGEGARLRYRIAPVQGQPSVVVDGTAGPKVTNSPVPFSTLKPGGSTGPLVYPGLKRLQIDPRLNPDYRFSTLVEGECNKLGILTGMEISDNPGNTPYNPLFIFGGCGLGKTHLAQAIGNAIKEKNPECTVLYVTGTEFKTKYMDATQRNILTEFLSFYMKIDVLIVDDIQDMRGQGNQSAFFSIFNHLHLHNRQLILTSDRAPKELENFEERLLSRFKWGLSVELKHPDYNTRLSMLQSKCEREGLMISDDVLRYIAMNIRSNFRELEGALISLMAYSTFTHRDCSIEMAASVLENIVSEEKNDLTIEKVQAAVCEYFHITKEDLLSTSRKRQLVQARQISMYLCRNLIPNCSLSAIGAKTGGKDHSTVMHSCNNVSDLMSTDRMFKSYVTELEGILQPVGR
jgi:chromosomal replication initiator protein